MAYAALVSLLHITDQILDLGLCFFPFTREKIDSFRETVGSLVAFLDKCPPICSQTVHDLITEIREASYEAEDILEPLIATHLLQKDGTDDYRRFPEISFEQIIEKLESINIELRKIQPDGSGIHERRISALVGSSRSALRDYDTKMEALDSDMAMQLNEQLVGGRSKMDVISIVGMGGIGKTTLAKILYDSQLIKETFHIRGWATISQTYDIHEIVENILKVVGESCNEKKDVEQQLYQSLWGRKYLIVLDDVWDTHVWDDIKRLFPDNNNGSRIILTTRQSQVAAYVNSFSTCHKMQTLTEDLSWSLLCKEIFPQNNCPSKLVEIGKEIARQCQGLPLAISAIGGHLKKKKQTKKYWKHVSENICSVIKSTNDASLEILTLSFNYLPHHLKACFLYFGSFQEDEAIDVSNIVKLWVAEGFVKPHRSNSMEEVAEEYLRDVIERNLVFVYKYDSLGKPKTCGIHDLFRDICIREAKKEKFLCVLDRNVRIDLTEINRQRRLILSPNMIEDDESPSSGIVSRNGSCSAARSFVCHGKHAPSSTIKLASVLLKVLNIRIDSFCFPIEIFELGNLKYLHLSLVLKIPSSISRLRNLQTLISSPMNLKSVPSEIWEMPRLRHLLIGSFHLPDIPDVQGKESNSYVLESLQTLVEIINFRCTQEVLGRTPNLKMLNILYRDFDNLFYSLNNLVYLRKLESLRCDFRFGLNDNILRNLTFPLSMKKLVLVGCRIPWERMTIIGVLPNLEVLKVKNRAMAGKLWETNDGEFMQLKFLLIGYSDLEEWKTEKDHFPRLRHLLLKVCRHLKAIPYEIGEIPTLERIELDFCSRDLVSSAEGLLGEDSDIELIISR